MSTAAGLVGGNLCNETTERSNSAVSREVACDPSTLLSFKKRKADYNINQLNQTINSLTNFL